MLQKITELRPHLCDIGAKKRGPTASPAIAADTYRFVNALEFPLGSKLLSHTDHAICVGVLWKVLASGSKATKWTKGAPMPAKPAIHNVARMINFFDCGQFCRRIWSDRRMHWPQVQANHLPKGLWHRYWAVVQAGLLIWIFRIRHSQKLVNLRTR